MAKWKTEHPAVATVLKQWLKIYVDEDGVLHSRTSHQEQLVVSKAYHLLVFKEVHQDMGHLGVERMLDLIQEKFYWPQLHKEVEYFVSNVCKCLKKKKPSKQTPHTLDAHPYHPSISVSLSKLSPSRNMQAWL